MEDREAELRHQDDLFTDNEYSEAVEAGHMSTHDVCERSGEQAIDVGQRDFEGRLCEAVDRNKGNLTLKGQINMGAEMTVTNTHVHDNRVINKSVQHHHGDVHTHVTNKVIKKGDVYHHHGDLHQTQIVQQNENEAGYEQIKDQSLTEILTDQDLFVETERYRTAADMLCTRGILVLCGPQASGKSCMARALLRHHHSLDWTPLVLRRFEEWRHHVGGERKQIVLLEHVLGQDEANIESAKVWADTVGLMEEFVRNQKCLVVFTLNDRVRAELISQQVFQQFDKYVFDLTVGQPFTDVEKTQMLNTHLARQGQTLKDEEISDILARDTTGLLFPSRCKQFSLLQEDDPKRLKLFTEEAEQTYSACGLGPKVHVRISPELIRKSRQKPQAQIMRLADTMYALTGYNDIGWQLSEQDWTPVEKDGHEVESAIAVDGGSDPQEGGDNAQTASRQLVFEGDTPLHEACRNNDLDLVTQLLSAGDDPAVKNKTGRSPLHVACDLDLQAIVSKLLDHMAQVDIADDDGWTPIHLASYRGHAHLVSMLISNGAAVDPKSCNDVTPLQLASRHGHLETARLLLESGANPDSKRRLGATALHAAAFAGHVDIVDLLIQFKAKSDVQDHSGWTPLHLACQEGHVKVVETLLSSNIPKGASGGGKILLRVDCFNGHDHLVKSLLQCGVLTDNPNGTVSVCSVCAAAHHLALENVSRHNPYTDMTTKGSITGLYLAAQNGHTQVVKVLMEAGACPEIGLKSLGWTPLHLVSYKGDMDTLDVLLQYHVNIEVRLHHVRHTPLLLASRQGHKRVVDRLLSRGASPFARTCQGDTPLHVACIFGHAELLDSLMKATRDLTIRNVNGCTPLSRALRYGNAAVLRKLTEGGVTLNLEPGTSTDLHKSAKSGHVDILAALGEMVTDIDVKDDHGRTALQISCIEGQSEAAQVLISLGASVNVLTPSGETLLHLVGGKDDSMCSGIMSLMGKDLYTPDVQDDALVDVVQVLLDGGVNMEARDSCGDTALHRAAYRGCFNITAKLLQHGALVNVKNDEGETPVYQACRFRRMSVVDVLIQHGADINIASADCTTPLHRACMTGVRGVVEKLLLAGANTELKDTEGRTPLMEASELLESCTDIGTVLLAKGANVNAADDEGLTSLHIACSGGKVDLAVELIHYGANVSCHDNEGCTPLHAASKNDNTEIVEMLLNVGSDIHATDNDGDTPLHHACAQGHVEVAKMLLASGAQAYVKNKAGKSPMNLVSVDNRAGFGFIFMEHTQNVSAENMDINPQRTTQRTVGAAQPGADSNVLSSGETNNSDSIVPPDSSTLSRNSTTYTGEAGGSPQSSQRLSSSHAGEEESSSSLVKTDTTNTSDAAQHSPATDSDHQLLQCQFQDTDKPLHSACYQGNHERVLELLQEGHGVNAVCQTGRTPLHYACAGKHVTITEMLIENEANVNAQDSLGRTPLHYGCGSGDLTTVDVLLTKGADLEVKDELGRTPLHWAACSGQAMAAALLLAQKTNVNMTDNNGDTPLHLACRQGNNDVTILLLNYGADVRAKNKKRQTALASAGGKMQVVQTLERHM